jgi:hypothetical protein
MSTNSFQGDCARAATLACAALSFGECKADELWL